MAFVLISKELIENNQDKHPLVNSFKNALSQGSKLPNAKVMGRLNQLVMMSDPLLDLLTDEEEKAVLAHEFCHVIGMDLHLQVPARFYAKSDRNCRC